VILFVPGRIVAARINRLLRHVHMSRARRSSVQKTRSKCQSGANYHTWPLRLCGTQVKTADAQKLMGGVDASGNVRVLDNVVDAQGIELLVPGIGMDLDRFCSWLPDRDVPELSEAAHKDSHPGFTGAVAEKLGKFGIERAARIQRAVVSLTNPNDIAEATISANRIAEEQILRLKVKIRKGLGKPLTLHRDVGHVTSFKVLEAWRRALQ